MKKDDVNATYVLWDIYRKGGIRGVEGIACAATKGAGVETRYREGRHDAVAERQRCGLFSPR